MTNVLILSLCFLTCATAENVKSKRSHFSKDQSYQTQTTVIYSTKSNDILLLPKVKNLLSKKDAATFKAFNSKKLREIAPLGFKYRDPSIFEEAGFFKTYDGVSFSIGSYVDKLLRPSEPSKYDSRSSSIEYHHAQFLKIKHQRSKQFLESMTQ